MRRSIVVVVAAVLIGVTPATTSHAAKPKLPRRPTVVAVESPVGLQGVAGAGANVVVPFWLFDRHRRPSDIQVQYGYDRNGDGMITDGTESAYLGQFAYPNEYSNATEDLRDPRDTRQRMKPFVYTSGLDTGAAHAFVWNTKADFPFGQLLFLKYKTTPQGRFVPDPDNPGSFVYATGPDGDAFFAGVKLRVRSAWHRRGHRRPLVGPWIDTRVLEVDNTRRPSMTLNGAAPDPDHPGTILVNWTAFHPDSEDRNGNGVLDVADGEDANGDGELFAPRMGVAFDWHIVAPGADPTMTPAQLAKLTWYPCTRKAGVGDTDSLDTRPGVSIPRSGDLAGVASAPPGVGRHWTFAWDAAAEGWPADGYMIRATPFDQWGNHGPMIYATFVAHPGQ